MSKKKKLLIITIAIVASFALVIPAFASTFLDTLTFQQMDSVKLTDVTSANNSQTFKSPRLVVKAQSAETVTLAWKRVKGGKRYVVYQQDMESGKMTRIKTFNEKTKRCVITGFKAGDEYAFRVKAYGKSVGFARESSWSNTVRGKTPTKISMSDPGFWDTVAGQVIKTGESKLGAPYAYGCYGPYYFDCSGFVSWTLMEAGVLSSREDSRGFYYTYNDQYGIGTDLNDAQPGDIIICGYGGSPYSIYHVGLYYDKGDYIHATYGGDDYGVSITPVPEGQVVAIIRLPALR